MTGGPGITPWARLSACYEADWWDELQPGALIVVGNRRLLQVKELARAGDRIRTPTHLNALDLQTRTCVRMKGGYVEERHITVRAVDLLADYPAIAKRWHLLRPAPTLETISKPASS